MAKSVLGVGVGVGVVEKDLLELRVFCSEKCCVWYKEEKPVEQIQPPLRAVGQSLNSKCDSLEEQ